MNKYEALEQEAERMGLSEQTRGCLGNCATCAHACAMKAKAMEAVAEDDGLVSQIETSEIADSQEISLKPKTPEEIVEKMRKAMGDDRINEVFAEYIRQIKPMQVVPRSNYYDKRNYFAIPA